MSYTYYIYKTWEKVKSKYTMRICSLREHRLKHEWNQMVWSVNNLRCGTAPTTVDGKSPRDASTIPQSSNCAAKNAVAPGT